MSGIAMWGLAGSAERQALVAEHGRWLRGLWAAKPRRGQHDEQQGWPSSSRTGRVVRRLVPRQRPAPEMEQPVARCA
jgi:hypothetical protein